MLMDWKAQYYLYSNSSQIDLWIQYSLYQNPRWDFAKIDKLISEFIWRGKEPSIAETIFTKKNVI